MRTTNNESSCWINEYLIVFIHMMFSNNFFHDLFFNECLEFFFIEIWIMLD